MIFLLFIKTLTKKDAPQIRDAPFNSIWLQESLLNHNFLAIVDVDARNAWHAIELNAHQVVVSVVGLSVSTNSADSGWSCVLGDNHHERLLQALAAALLNGDVIFASFLNLEV